jgi:hypothetical protein
LPLQPSLRFDWKIDPNSALERFWVEKGADTPSAQGTHLDALQDGDSWQGSSSTYARPIQNQPREMIPYLMVDSPAATTAAARIRHVGIEFSGPPGSPCSVAALRCAAGASLDPCPAPTARACQPAADSDPTIFIGAFAAAGAPATSWRWVRAVSIIHTTAESVLSAMVSNSWGSGMAVNESLAQRMIENPRLGWKCFIWTRVGFDVGDWQADR